jgi:hypothetical protein
MLITKDPKKFARWYFASLNYPAFVCLTTAIILVLANADKMIARILIIAGVLLIGYDIIIALTDMRNFFSKCLTARLRKLLKRGQN